MFFKALIGLFAMYFCISVKYVILSIGFALNLPSNKAPFLWYLMLKYVAYDCCSIRIKFLTFPSFF